ncbi:MAG: hypothetical protein AB8B41_05420, partial [Prochlorococcus sp.]
NQKEGECTITNDSKTIRTHQGQWKFDKNPETSSFASPDFKTCADISKCNIKLTFNKEQTDKFIDEYNLELRISSDQAKPSATEINNESPPPFQQEPPEALSIAWPFILLVSSASLLVIALLVYIWSFFKPQKKKSVGNRKRRPISDLSTPAPQLNDFTPQNDANSIRLIISRLDKLDNQMAEIQQEQAQAKLRLSRPLNNPKPSIGISESTTQHANLVSTSNPSQKSSLPLNLELIKQAIVTNNYNLIASSNHHFITETSESREGRLEKKQFQVDGDQSQSNIRASSEFIAIHCNDIFYLIPNIVPNSSDPLRTLKRLSDSNSIYLPSQGSNSLAITTLATVEKIGPSKYQLLKPGRLG